jgi:hypothetical protein
MGPRGRCFQESPACPKIGCPIRPGSCPLIVCAGAVSGRCIGLASFVVKCCARLRRLPIDALTRLAGYDARASVCSRLAGGAWSAHRQVRRAGSHSRRSNVGVGDFVGAAMLREVRNSHRLQGVGQWWDESVGYYCAGSRCGAAHALANAARVAASHGARVEHDDRATRSHAFRLEIVAGPGIRACY